MLEQLILENQMRIAPLKAKYPRVFSHLEFWETLDGWNDLIITMSYLIESYIESLLPEELKDHVYYSQVKQKFGYLKVHMSHYVPQIQGIISMAEAMSCYMCEVCGAAANQRNVRGWITTLCDSHYQEKLEKEV